MTEQNWDSDLSRCVGVFLNGEGIADVDPRGVRVTDDSFLLWFNSYWEDIEATLPSAEFGTAWETVVDTASGEVHPPVYNEPERDTAPSTAGSVVTVPARSLLVLRRKG